jgi:hypothetical protein
MMIIGYRVLLVHGFSTTYIRVSRRFMHFKILCIMVNQISIELLKIVNVPNENGLRSIVDPTWYFVYYDQGFLSYSIV